MIVHGGTWELCTDAGYGGNCRLRAGRYPNLGFGQQVSSLRRMQEENR